MHRPQFPVFAGISLLMMQHATAATIVNYSGIADDYYNGISMRFLLNPVDANTPLGVDSIYFKINGLNVTEQPFVSAFVLDTQTNFQFGIPNIQPSPNADILGLDRIVIHFPKLTSPTELDITVFGINPAGLVGEVGITKFVKPFTVDLILNPAFGSNPSALGQQDFPLIASQSNYVVGYVGVPEPASSFLAACGLGALAVRRKRDRSRPA